MSMCNGVHNAYYALVCEVDYKRLEDKEISAYNSLYGARRATSISCTRYCTMVQISLNNIPIQNQWRLPQELFKRGLSVLPSNICNAML